MKATRKNTRSNRNQTRRALVQALDSRKLMAADAGLEVCAPYDPSQETAAEVSSVSTDNYGPIEGFTDTSDNAAPDSDFVTAPVGNGDSYELNAGEVLQANVLDNDLPGEVGENSESIEMTAKLVTPPSRGTLDINEDGSFKYRPSGDYVGEDFFEYQANNGEESSEVTKVKLYVHPAVDQPDADVPQGPTPEDDHFKTVNTKSLSEDVTSNDAAKDISLLTARVTKMPSHGQLEFNADGTFTYTPDSDYVGNDAFAYVLHDGEERSETAVVNIKVEADPDAGSREDGVRKMSEEDELNTDAKDTDEVFHQFGDGDGNGVINFDDFFAFRDAFGSTADDASYNAAFDSEGDGVINFDDLFAFREVFGQSV